MHKVSQLGYGDSRESLAHTSSLNQDGISGTTFCNKFAKVKSESDKLHSKSGSPVQPIKHCWHLLQLL